MDLLVKCYADLDVSKASKILVNAARTYLGIINANKELKPFLVEHPFGPKNIYFAVYVAYPGKNDVEIDKLTTVSIIKGKIIYNIRKTQFAHEIIHKETFEEAERIVEKEQQGT